LLEFKVKQKHLIVLMARTGLIVEGSTKMYFLYIYWPQLNIQTAVDSW